jgi:hypothetical protein
MSSMLQSLAQRCSSVSFCVCITVAFFMHFLWLYMHGYVTEDTGRPSTNPA